MVLISQFTGWDTCDPNITQNGGNDTPWDTTEVNQAWHTEPGTQITYTWDKLTL
jgi:hypothetical protein